MVFNINRSERFTDPKYKPVVEHNHRKRQTFKCINVLDESTNRVVKKTILVDCKKDKFREFKVDDFSMENLQLAGTPLNPTTLHHDKLTVISQMEDSVVNIANQSNNQSNKE